MKRTLLLTLLCPFVFLAAQQIPDSLKSYSFDELFIKLSKDSIIERKKIFNDAIIAKAKKEKDTLNLASGYHIYTKLLKDERVLKYCDSIIELGLVIPNGFYPIAGYLEKGYYYFRIRAFQRALNYYLMAHEYAKKYDNKYYIFSSNHAIGVLKSRIGENLSALNVHQKNFQMIKNDSLFIKDGGYLNTIFSLATTFENLKQLDSASYYNRLGIKEAIRLKEDFSYNHFVLNEGVVLFDRKSYEAALDSIQKSLPFFEKIENLPNMAVGYYYLGETLLNLSRTTEAMESFKRVDTVFRKNKDILPKTRKAYERLINYYKQQKQPQQQLIYINQLIQLDSILHQNELYLNKNIIKEYDIPNLLSEKQKVIQQLEIKSQKNKFLIVSITLLLGLISGGFFYQSRQRKIYKKRFLQLMEQSKSSSSKAPLENKKELSIAKNVVDQVLQNLETFEKSKEFLSQELTIYSMAKKLNTNTKYLSSIINHHKGHSFITYINNLRIDHVVEQLQINAVFRKYSLKAITEEIGFKKTESFSKAFFKRTGLKPSYFINQLHTALKNQ